MGNYIQKHFWNLFLIKLQAWMLSCLKFYWKKAQTQVFSSEYCVIFKNTNFEKHSANSCFWTFKDQLLRNDASLHCVKSVRIRTYSGPHFPAFGLNTEIYLSFRIQSQCVKMRTRITPNMDTFYEVLVKEQEIDGFKRYMVNVV